MYKRNIVLQACCSVALLICGQAHAQTVPPYPNAITNRFVYAKTFMLPPRLGTFFTDPDFGSEMVRVTDESTDASGSRSAFRSPGGTASAWSADGQKFYVIGRGGAKFAFGFDAATMSVRSLPRAQAGAGVWIPLRGVPTFSLVDPDLIYGTLPNAPLTIATYRFSNGITSPLIDTTKCATEPALAPHVFTDDVTVSTNDQRVVVAEGANQFGAHMFLAVYDKHLGCRWYNTQTGQIRGKWGVSGQTSINARFLVRHASISGSGRYVKIEVDHFGFYVWDVATLNVTACPTQGGPACGQYAALGYNDYINAAGEVDEMNTLKRFLGNLNQFRQLVNPLPLPHFWGMEKRFTWSNGRLNDNAPVCGTTYSYDGDPSVTQPYDGEIFCIETDGLQSTIWRFGHNRAVWNPSFFYTAPLVNISPDARFLLFTSSWDNQVGTTDTGAPRTDVWIVKLD